jgi:hypothetical protein
MGQGPGVRRQGAGSWGKGETAGNWLRSKCLARVVNGGRINVLRARDRSRSEGKGIRPRRVSEGLWIERMA